MPAIGAGIEIDVDGEKLRRFLVSGARAVVIQGPWGSGKSTAACLKLLLNALRQPPDPVSGKRRRVTYVVRNTFDELERTTIKTWQKIFPPDRWGRPEGNKPKIHRIRAGDLEWDVWFVALDREEDTAKLLSAELSDVWFNELREIPRRLFKDALDRTNRWPDAIGGCYRPQAIGDTNPAAEDHWISIMSGQRPIPEGIDEEEAGLLTRPADWEILVQPPAMLEARDGQGQAVYLMNPERENKRWTGDQYYLDMLSGATRQQVAERVLNRPGLYRTGKAVWAEFHGEVHLAPAPLPALPGHVVLVGIDFGRTPAAVMGQCVGGRWRILAELATENTGAREFARLLKRKLATSFPDNDFALWGDPAGDNLEQSDDNSPFLMLRAEGLVVLKAPGNNDPIIRRDAVKELLLGLAEGKPRFLLSPACVTLRAALEGGYQYPRRNIAGGGTVYADTPLKNRYSHIADALQYLVLGGGEGGALLGRIRPGAGTMTGAAARVVRAPPPRGIGNGGFRSW